MKLSASDWERYIFRMAKISQTAAEKMQTYIDTFGAQADMDRLIEYAYGLSTKYGEAAASLACEMYDAVADASGKTLLAAEPAETATYNETAKAIHGTMNNSPGSVSQTVGRLVKQAGADTTLKNAQRDGAQFAWVPHGDTCAFCITLASRGWQHMSKKALRNGHAEHIHANCDCEYAIRFDESGGVKGYDPDKYLSQYENAEGGTPQEKVNSMRRQWREAHKDEVNAEKREAYKKSLERVLQTQLGFVYNNAPKFIPLHTIIEESKVIAGKGSTKELRDTPRLVAIYGGTPDNWEKRVGKVYSDKFVFDIHWYEYEGKMYEYKIKYFKEKG